MQELKQHEVEVVAGGDLEGAIWGLGEGLATGAAIGGSISAGSGWGFGLIGQLVGVIVGPIVGAIFGFVGGALTNKETMAAVGADYRESMGWNSTGGIGTVSPPAAASSAILRPNSKNCVAWTSENGIGDSSISFSCATFARK